MSQNIKLAHLLISAWLLAGCLMAGLAFTQTQSTFPDDPELYQRGLELYQTLSCGTCHTLDTAGTKGTFGPNHNGLAQTAALRLQNPGYKGQAKTAQDYIRESIVNPKAYLAPGFELSRIPMPLFDKLSQEDLDALVYMLSHQF
jgi:nitric oxide reductase subunit C